jgi:hypothetical protein
VVALAELEGDDGARTRQALAAELSKLPRLALKSLAQAGPRMSPEELLRGERTAEVRALLDASDADVLVWGGVVETSGEPSTKGQVVGRQVADHHGVQSRLRSRT